MREIKFRAWNGYMMLKHEDFITIGKELCQEAGKGGEYEGCLVIPNHKDIELMQYTGIKDISGNEIYEGDIVTSESTGPGLGSFFKGIVKFYDGTYCIENEETELVIPLFEEANELHTIGNIFENIVLLK